jgi:hypothetical protein
MEKRGSDASTSGSPAEKKVTHREYICGCIHTGYALTSTLVWCKHHSSFELFHGFAAQDIHSANLLALFLLRMHV